MNKAINSTVSQTKGTVLLLALNVVFWVPV